MRTGGKNMNAKRISLTLVIAILLTAMTSVLPVFSTASAETNENLTVSEALFENVSMNVGSDETERNFIWHSSSVFGALEFAEYSGNGFPSEYKTIETTVTRFNGKYVHRATVYGLDYETSYVYRFRSGDTVSEPRVFDTDPIDHFNFIYVGDPQIGAYGPAKDTANWKATLAKATEMFPGTSLLVSAGDQTDVSTNTIQLEGLLAPDQLDSLAFATSIGNHDYNSSFYKNYFNLPNTQTDGKVYGKSEAGGDYWYTYNNVLFLHINTCNISWAEHKEFMQKAIAANPDVTWKIVITHYSFFGAGEYYINEQIGQRREQFAPLVDELGIDAVLSGHEHSYARAYMINNGTTPDNANGPQSSVTDHEGVFYLTAGSSSGSKFYKILDDAYTPHVAYKLKDTIAFSNVEVDKNSFKITTYSSTDGSVIDSFEIIKHKTLTNVDPMNEDVADKKNYETNGTSSKYPNASGKLTDGKLAQGTSSTDTAYVGFDSTTTQYKSKGYGSVTVDLGSVKDVDRFVAYVATSKGGSSIKAPKSMAVYVSENGTNYTSAGTVSITDDSKNNCIPVTLRLDKAVSARYVQFRFVANGTLAMVAEVDVFKHHVHTQADWTTLIEPTYHLPGTKVKRCIACGTAYEYEFSPRLELPEGNTNVALGKKYDNSPLYKKDNNEKYPDETGTTMTDGVLASEGAIYSAAEYMGFNINDDFYKANGYFCITVDLEANYYLNKFVAFTASKAATAGVVAPKNVAFYVSEDRENWFYAGDVSPVDTDAQPMVAAEITLENAVYGRYVQYRFKPTTSFVMVAEIEAHKTDVEEHEHIPGVWIEVMAPTLEKEGRQVKNCTICGVRTDDGVIPKLDASAYGKNLALGKTYTSSNPYVHASDGKVRYPDENGKSMTDGKVAPDDATYSHEAFFGLYARNQDYVSAGYFHFTFDLGREFDLRRFTVYTSSAYNMAAGLGAPKSFEVHVSDDGKTWKFAGSVLPEDSMDISCIAINVVLEKAVTARYVQFRLVASNTFLMVAETEIYGFDPRETADKIVGDVNGDGAIDKFDYILVKRYVMGTITLNDSQTDAADVNGDGKLDKFDYIFLKRHVMGTYKIGG